MTHEYGIKEFAGMMLAAKRLLEKNCDMINKLNVFPVPDGDTGLNMLLTIKAACEEMDKADKGYGLSELCKGIARGALMGARGNSGVILSQIFRGFAKSINNSSAMTPFVFAQALQDGVGMAYKSVMKPVEGTILTVSREAARTAMGCAHNGNDMVTLMAETLQQAERTLNTTPDMLPVLKEAGVVDAGGMGFVQIIRGFYSYVAGEDVCSDVALELPNFQHVPIIPNEITGYRFLEDIVYRYCTEILIHDVCSSQLNEIENHLSNLGDSLVLVNEEDKVKIHIHTNHPDQVLNRCIKFGGISNAKIENMHLQYMKNNSKLPDTIKEGIGVLAIVSGEGIAAFFKSMGTDAVLNGGQMMNPSTEEIAAAARMIALKNIIVLPNNGNIIMAAKQAQELCADQRIVVLPSKSIPQGISAMIDFNPSLTIEMNEEKMEGAMERVRSIEITYAVRDTIANGLNISQGDYIALLDGGIVKAGENLDDTVISTISEAIRDEDEIVTIIAGQDVIEQAAENLVAELRKTFPRIEFELYFGKQPLYFYIISVE